jgi:hypothetical protein
MYAAHLAAGLAIKSRVPRAPTWALLGGAFLCDFAWVGLATAGIEPSSPPAAFFDDWSHSLASTLLLATAFAACFFHRHGRVAAAAIWLAVASHVLLDFPFHPKPLALWPHSSVHIGLVGTTRDPAYWWVQLAIVAVLTLVFLAGARRHQVPGRLAAAAAWVVLSLHWLVR